MAEFLTTTGVSDRLEKSSRMPMTGSYLSARSLSRIGASKNLSRSKTVGKPMCDLSTEKGNLTHQKRTG